MAVFGYIEGSFLVNTDDAPERHVPNMYRCMNT